MSCLGPLAPASHLMQSHFELGTNSLLPGCRIYNLRKPKTNIQILQQNVLLKHRHLMQFMRRHGRETAAEVRAAYVETLSRVLSGHFKAYLTALEPLLVRFWPVLTFQELHRMPHDQSTTPAAARSAWAAPLCAAVAASARTAQQRAADTESA